MVHDFDARHIESKVHNRCNPLAVVDSPADYAAVRPYLCQNEPGTKIAIGSLGLVISQPLSSRAFAHPPSPSPFTVLHRTHFLRLQLSHWRPVLRPLWQRLAPKLSSLSLCHDHGPPRAITITITHHHSRLLEPTSLGWSSAIDGPCCIHCGDAWPSDVYEK